MKEKPKGRSASMHVCIARALFLREWWLFIGFVFCDWLFLSLCAVCNCLIIFDVSLSLKSHLRYDRFLPTCFSLIFFFLFLYHFLCAHSLIVLSHALEMLQVFFCTSDECLETEYELGAFDPAYSCIRIVDASQPGKWILWVCLRFSSCVCVCVCVCVCACACVCVQLDFYDFIWSCPCVFR